MCEGGKWDGEWDDEDNCPVDCRAPQAARHQQRQLLLCPSHHHNIQLAPSIAHKKLCGFMVREMEEE
jgi:hypothetical protein